MLAHIWQHYIRMIMYSIKSIVRNSLILFVSIDDVPNEMKYKTRKCLAIAKISYYSCSLPKVHKLYKY